MVHVLNLSPSVPLDGDIPDRVWTGKEVSYNHLRVFGCKAYVHIPKDERSKLDSKTRECVFIRYGLDDLGYRFHDPVNKKLIRSRDPVFLEDQIVHDIEKGQNLEPISRSDLVDLNHIPLAHVPIEVEETVEGETSTSRESHIHDDGDHDHDFMAEQEVEEDDEQPEEVPLRRSTRDRQPSTRYTHDQYVLLTDAGEPECYNEAVSSECKNLWIDAMNDEMESLRENHTFELVKLPKGRKALRNKWVYKLKQDDNLLQPRYKARLVVKGFGQKKGIDFDEIFSPVVKMSSIRAVLGIAACQNLEIEQMDVKTAFLHGDLEEEIFMKQPEGFVVEGKEEYVWRLKKSLYGLKQAPRQWYKKFMSIMREQGYKKKSSDNCVFVKKFADGDFIILLLYVDDMLIVGKDTSRIDSLKKQLSKSFAMKDLGPAKQILGIQITRDRDSKKLFLSQEKYIEKVLQKFRMDKAKVVSSPLASHFKLSKNQCPSTDDQKRDMANIPYASAVGSLMYAMVCTGPDLAHAVGVVSRFLSNPGKEHWNAVKWIMRYLRGTSKLKLSFGMENVQLVAYSDSDLAGDIDTRKSTSGYLIKLCGGAVSWKSRLQVSTTESEFIAVTEASKELLWLKKFLKELGFEQNRYVLLCDNQSAIHLVKNSSFHSKSKHIEVRYHWIQDVLDAKLMEVDKVHTDENGSDMMTKSLPRGKLEHCKLIAGMVITPTSS